MLCFDLASVRISRDFLELFSQATNLPNYSKISPRIASVFTDEVRSSFSCLCGEGCISICVVYMQLCDKAHVSYITPYVLQLNFRCMHWAKYVLLIFQTFWMTALPALAGATQCDTACSPPRGLCPIKSSARTPP